MLRNTIQILWGIFLFIFPFSIRFLVYEDSAYRFGNFNPFVSGFIYLSEVLLIIVFVLWVIQRFKDLKIERFKDSKFKIQNSKFKINFNWLLVLFLLFIINAGVVTVWQGDWVLFVFFFLRVAEAVMVFLLVRSELLPIKTVVKILLGGALFQLIWGYAQWQLNHSLGFTRLGEAVLGPDVPGVAKTDLVNGGKQIRPYGFFLHPNILATYLMSILFISIPYLKKYVLIFWMIILTAGVFFTQSLAASLVVLLIFAFIIIFGIFKKIDKRRWIALSALLILLVANIWFFQNSHAVVARDVSFQERLNQNVISRNMFIANPLGVGVGNFTLEMELYSGGGSNWGSNWGADGGKLLPWEFQPVHNTYFLILNELGVQGILLLFIAIGLFIYRYWKGEWMMPILALIFIAPFDHFLWDSFVGVMLIGLVVGFFSVSHES